MNIQKKILQYLSGAIFIFGLLQPLSFVHAQNYVDGGIPEAVQQARESGTLNNEGYVYKQDNVILAKKIEDMIGAVPGITAVANDPEYNKRITQHSMLSQINSTIVAMYTHPPATMYAFVQDFGQTLGFIPKQALAQQNNGAVFAGLSPILPIWKVFRNIAYALIGFIIMIVGFLIMFRKKIDPKTVVTIQNSIPKIVISLIVITFSYAIVAFLIEIMYVCIYLVAGIFLSTGLVNNAMDYTKSVPIDINPINLSGTNTDFTPGVLTYKLLGTNTTPAGAFGLNVLRTLLGAALGAATGTTPGFFIGLILGGSSLLFTFIVGIALILLAIRLFFFFLGAYIKIILALVFGPIQLIMGAIPGSHATEQWFKGLLSNLIVFPIGAAMFMLAQVFMNFSTTSQTMWTAPYVGLIDNPVSIAAFIALGILFTIPNVANQVQDSFKSKPMIGAGPEAIGGILGQPVQLGWQIGQFMIQRQQMKALSENVKKGAGK